MNVTFCLQKYSSFAKVFRMLPYTFPYTVKLRWLEPLRDHENLFELSVVRVTEGYY